MAIGRLNAIKVMALAAGAALVACKGKESQGTPEPGFTSTPDFIPTVTPTGTVIPIASPGSPFNTETVTPSPTETMVNYEKDYLRALFVANWEGLKTHYLGGLNRLVNESSGESMVERDAFTEYFIAREDLAAEGLPVSFEDKAFAQLNRRVVDFTDRAPDFHRRNGGQGLGFTQADLAVLTTYEDAVLKEANGEIISNERDGYSRAWLLAKANQADRSVLAIVDNWLRLQSYDPFAEELQDLRRRTFDRIMYEDLGVMPTGDGGGGEWWTVTSNGRFDIACSTFTAEANTRSQQPETTRLLSFYPLQETLGNQIEEERETVLDADDSVLVVGVIDQNKYLRVEVYTLCNAPDSSNASMDQPYGIQLPAAFYRWLPCGPGAPVQWTPTGHPGGILPPEYPSSPMPTNAHIFTPRPPKPEKPPKPPQPTEIP